MQRTTGAHGRGDQRDRLGESFLRGDLPAAPAASSHRRCRERDGDRREATDDPGDTVTDEPCRDDAGRARTLLGTRNVVEADSRSDGACPTRASSVRRSSRVPTASSRGRKARRPRPASITPVPTRRSPPRTTAGRDPVLGQRRDDPRRDARASALTPDPAGKPKISTTTGSPPRRARRPRPPGTRRAARRGGEPCAPRRRSPTRPAPDVSDGKVDVGHQRHRLEPPERDAPSSRAPSSEPSCPVFIAWSMSRASPPRTSPTTIRSGRIRARCEISDRDLAATLDGRRSGLQTDDVWLGES